MEGFKYKVNKTINLWIVEDHNLDDLKESKIELFWVKIELEKTEVKQNRNIEKEQIDKLKDIFWTIENHLNIVLKYEKFFKYSFESIFYYTERKKLAQNRVSEEIVNSKILNKYRELFRNFRKNVYFLWKHSEAPEENLEKLSNILKTIRYLKYDLEQLNLFIENFNYHWNNEKKKKSIKTLKNESENIKTFSEKILKYYSKKSGKWEEIFKVALNPAILNTDPDINREYKINEWELKILEKETKSLERKNDENKEIKRKFLDYVDSYMNHILYEKDFFKNKNEIWCSRCKDLYKKLSEKKIKLWKAEDYFYDFLNKNPIKISDEIKFPDDIKEKFFNEKFEVIWKDQWRFFEWIYLKNYNFVQINTLKYRLTWKKVVLKKENKEYKKISEYISILKWEINTRLKKWKYWKFVWFKGDKIKIAQDFSQKKNEFLNKSNFDKELKAYNKFWYLIKWENRVFLYLLDKENIIETHKGFTYEIAKKEIEKYQDENSNYKAFIFQSLTLKGLTKLVFIKNAFEKDFEKDDKEFYNIYKQKSYAEKRNWKCNDWYEKNLQKYIDFLLNCLKSEKWKKLFDYVKIEQIKRAWEYKSLIEFEKDLLKVSYKIKENLLEKECFLELDIVDRKFEENNEKPKMKRQNDIKIFYEFLDSIWEKNNYENLRILPEIKLYLSTKLKEENKNEKDKRKVIKTNGKEYFRKQRLYRNKLTASFLFEYNPLEINKTPEHIKREKEKYFREVLQQYEKDDNFSIFWIDIWENEFATLGIYDKKIKLKSIEINNDKKEQIVDLTNLKLESWKIVKKDSKNSEKYKFFKAFYEQIIHYQINLKDILENIWEIELKKENFQNIKNLISKSVDNNLNEKFDFRGNQEYLKKFFPIFIDEKEYNFSWLKQFLFDFIKNQKCKKLGIIDSYSEIFKQLEMMKVINFKDAFGSNFVWVIKYLLKENPWIIIFENLWNNKKYDFTHIITKKLYQKLSSEERNIMKSFWSYVWNYIFQAIANSLSKIFENGKIKQYIYFEKNITDTLKSKDLYWSNGIIFWVDEYCTSKACPACESNKTLTKIDDWKIISKNDNEIWKLYWHWKWEPWESNMHHCNENCRDCKNCKWNNENCDYHMKNNPWDFNFIKSWDDLATYNIAKKWIEFLKYNLK